VAINKILIINPFGIGDVLFTTSVTQSIKTAYPDSYVGYWCNERVAPLLKSNPDIDKVFGLSRGDLKKIWSQSRLRGIQSLLHLFQTLKASHYDVAIDFSLDHRYSILAKLAGIKRRIGFDYKKRGRFLTDKVSLEGFSEKHVIEYNLDLLNFLQIPVSRRQPYLCIGEQELKQSRKILESHGIRDTDVLVGISPGSGASWGRDGVRRQWPALRFAQVADRLIEELKVKVILFGDPSERSIADVVRYAMKHKAVDLVGKTTLEQLAALMSRLSVLLTNEGGPLHMAVALDVKTVSLFGPGDEKAYGPYPPSQKHIVLKSDIECRPCYEGFRLKPCHKEKECLNLISASEVFDAVRRLL
jgi:lipopolysaccharide heptosyltransferase II